MTRSRAQVAFSVAKREPLVFVSPNRRLATAKASLSFATRETWIVTPLRVAPEPSAATNVSPVRGACTAAALVRPDSTYPIATQ